MKLAGFHDLPYYDPLVVFAPPRPGIAIGGAIRFGPAVTIGAVFGGWGWWTGIGVYADEHMGMADNQT